MRNLAGRGIDLQIETYFECKKLDIKNTKSGKVPINSEFVKWNRQYYVAYTIIYPILFFIDILFGIE